MTAGLLGTALSKVDWNAHAQSFIQDVASTDMMAKASLRLAVWSKQFENLESGNPAICFVREMQMGGQYVTALVALALYKPAAASMRIILESALYYTYFRVHPAELTTLVRSSKYFMSKAEVMEFHKNHTENFGVLQQKLGLVTDLDGWYNRISAIMHGQIPGVWVTNRTLGDIKPVETIQKLAIDEFTICVDIVHRLFLCTTGRELWDNFTTTAKKSLIVGLPGDVKALLRLDSA